MKRLFQITLLIFLLFKVDLFTQDFNDDSAQFTFIFITDIHLQPERNAVEGFKKAIDEINKINPDFVITGGDLIYDALGVSYERADSLFNLYNETISLINSPVYNTIGNHEIFGWNEKSQVSRVHSEFGKKMYQNRIEKTYYSFDHKGVRFFILDSIEEVPEGGKYFGFVNDEQVEWLKQELIEIDSLTPIIFSTHIPFITTFSQIKAGSQKENERGLVIENSKEVLDLFTGHNLKLVLQGHLHYFEELNVQNKTTFITAGAVSARWWRGPNDGMEEGFLIVKIIDDEIFTEYFDYGWEVSE
ncbi:MAG: metallophosphoesterase [Ignavibacteriaceae bacterium]